VHLVFPEQMHERLQEWEKPVKRMGVEGGFQSVGHETYTRNEDSGELKENVQENKRGPCKLFSFI
jgi:hypothetical protein